MNETLNVFAVLGLLALVWFGLTFALIKGIEHAERRRKDEQ